MKAYASDGSADSSMRAFATELLRMTAGRSSEAAYAMWTTMEWDAFFSCAYFGAPQTKVSEIKLACLVAGASRHECPLTILGDYIALNPDRDLHIEGDELWLVPELQSVKSPGEKIGDFMRALLPSDRGGQLKYARVSVATLPDGITAGGARPGCATELGASGVPGEFSTLATGHDMTNFSTFYRYQRVERLLVNLCASVLAGWNATPYGQLAKGPVPATTDAIVGIDMTAFERYIDHLYAIDASAPPFFKQTGRLRPLLRASAASQSAYNLLQLHRRVHQA